MSEQSPQPILAGYRYALRLKPAQEALLRRYAGCCRFVWNEALAHIRAEMADGRRAPRYVTLANRLPALKIQYPWLREAPSQALQQTLKDLDIAIGAAFSKTDPRRFPTFKRRGERDTLRFPQGFAYDTANGRIVMPKLGAIRLRHSRVATGIVKNITLSLDAGRWMASLQTERTATIEPSTLPPVGIDRGVAVMAQLSDGNAVPAFDGLRRRLKHLAFLQRAVARKQKGSGRCRRAHARVAKLHRRIADMRRDFLHKATTGIANAYGMVALENLRVKNMTASAAGSLDEPGRNVRQKAGLNRSILDQGWSEFGRQLKYKLAWRGGQVVLVNPAHTSQRCHACGHVSPDNRKTQARFVCVACGHADNADVNAARNILSAGLRQQTGARKDGATSARLANEYSAAGLAALAHGGAALSSRPVKCEPARGVESCVS